MRSSSVTLIRAVGIDRVGFVEQRRGGCGFAHVGVTKGESIQGEDLHLGISGAAGLVQDRPER